MVIHCLSVELEATYMSELRVKTRGKMGFGEVTVAAWAFWELSF
jgi:hypothetical protein